MLSWKIPKSIPNSYVQNSTCWHTFDLLCSVLRSLVFIVTKILQPFLLLPSLRLVHPAAYDTLNLNAFFYWGISSRTLLVGNWPILPGCKQSLPRTTKAKFAHCYMQIIDSGRCLSRTPKCNLQWGWAHESKDSKSNLLVCARKR